MELKTITTLALIFLLFTACSTKKIQQPPKRLGTEVINTSSVIIPEAPLIQTTPPVVSPVELSPISPIEISTTEVSPIEPPARINSTITTIEGLSGDFSENYKLLDFIERMHLEHDFKREYLYKLFSEAKDINLITEDCQTRDTKGRCIVPLKPQGKWDRYKGMFIYERNVNRGVAFWEEHKNALNRAYQEYGVLPEFVIGILGVETAFGVNFGKKRVLDVLTSKSMLDNRREEFYTRQLEKFLIMTRESNLDPRILMGSNAGAMGYGQFIASSYLSFAVDFNNDGVIDLWDPEDAIGSIANYFYRNGWKRSIKQVAVRARYKGQRFKRLETGYKTKYSQYKLKKKYKIKARTKLHYRGPVSLIKLPKYSYDELWFGTHNFRVITTYNHSTFYGMAVFQLGQAIKKKRYGL